MTMGNAEPYYKYGKFKDGTNPQNQNDENNKSS